MSCYKCGSDKELSKKTKRLMICRPCRRAYANSRVKPIKQWAPDEEWYWQAHEKNNRIINKYSKVSIC